MTNKQNILMGLFMNPRFTCNHLSHNNISFSPFPFFFSCFPHLRLLLSSFLALHLFSFSWSLTCCCSCCSWMYLEFADTRWASNPVDLSWPDEVSRAWTNTDTRLSLCRKLGVYVYVCVSVCCRSFQRRIIVGIIGVWQLFKTQDGAVIHFLWQMESDLSVSASRSKDQKILNRGNNERLFEMCCFKVTTKARISQLM